MITIYDLLEIEEDASKEEIEDAYNKILYKYRQDPSFSEQTNQENEMIMNKIKIAYEILADENKRKRYDSDLSKKRAESLLKGLGQNEEDEIENPQEDEKDSAEVKDSSEDDALVNNQSSKEKPKYDFDDGDVNKYENEDIDEDDVELTKEEQEKLRKVAKDEFKKNLIKAKKAEEEYKKAYAEAYDDYMNKNKYVKNQSMTLRKFITTFVSLVVIVLVVFIIVHLPPVREAMNTIYEENIIIKSIVDIFKNF